MGLRAFLAGLALFAVASLSAAPPRTAVLDFTVADGVAGSDSGVLDFSRAVQAAVLASPDYAWVERQEFDHIVREVDLGANGGVDATAAVRLGHWLHADLLLRGEITIPATGNAELRLEVVDLKRADVLAARVVVVTVNPRRQPRPTPEEVGTTGRSALAALDEARQKLEQTSGLRVIAPLYFKNIGLTDRLDFVEEKLAAEFIRAAVPEGGFHVLQFPRSHAAGGESDLVLSGLTDMDPDAWERVADAYVSGTVTEKDAPGIAFEEVPVDIVVQIWTGAGPAREVRWDGPARDLEQGVRTVVADSLLKLKAAPPVAQRDKAERKRIAQALVRRANELKFPTNGSASAASQRLAAYQNRLLDTACFFDPLDKELQERRLYVRPMGASLAERWREVADFQTHARRFARRADGSVDESVVMPLTKSLQFLESGLQTLERKIWLSEMEPDKFQGEIRRFSLRDVQAQRRAVVAWWREEIIAANRSAGGPKPPAWLDTANRAWLRQFQAILFDERRLEAREDWEQLWPVLKRAVGLELHADDTPENYDGETDHSRLVADIVGIYEQFGDADRGIGMIDEAWKATAAENPAPANAVLRAPRHAAQELSWDQPAPEYAGDVGPANAPASAVPVLRATVREIEPWAKIYYHAVKEGVAAPLAKENNRTIDALAWHQGRLWFAETSRWPLPAEVGPANREGQHYLWSYDPALHAAELATAKIEGGHAEIRALQSEGGDLWVGLEGEGAWRWRATEPAPDRFKPEEGLIASRIGQIEAGTGGPFFLGGDFRHPVIARYDRAAGTWISEPVAPPEPGPAGGAPGLPVGTAPSGLMPAWTMAVSGDWLCTTNPQPRFYQLSTKQWQQLVPLPNPGRYLPPSLLMPDNYCTLTSADEHGFWLGAQNQLSFLDPNHPAERKKILVPGYPMAAAHAGSWLWVLLEDTLAVAQPAGKGMPTRKSPTRLALIDKRTFACVGQLTLPAGEMKTIAAAEGHVWVGGATLLEIIPTEVQPGEPAAAKDFPLIRAAWAGDLPGVKAALAEKADVNEASPGGWTPLLASAWSDRPEIARLLLQAGADAKRQPAPGATALQLAVEAQDEKLVEILLTGGADANAYAKTIVPDLSPIYPEVIRSKPPAAQDTIPRQPQNIKATPGPDGRILISWDDMADNEDSYLVVRTMLTLPGDNAPASKPSLAQRAINRRFPANTTRWIDDPDRTFGQFERREKAEPCRVVYQVYAINEANPHAADTAPSAGVECTITVPSLQALKEAPQWISRGGMADVVALDPLAATPLAMAAGSGALPGIDLLLRHGAEPNAPDACGRTALQCAVRAGRHDAALRLLEAGADPVRKDAEGESAIIAAYLRHTDKPLLQKMLSGLNDSDRWHAASELIMLAAERGQVPDLEMLRTLGGDIGVAYLGGESAVSRAVEFEQTEAAVWLIKAGFPIDHRVAGHFQEPILKEVMDSLERHRDAVTLGCLLDAGVKLDNNPLVDELATKSIVEDKIEIVRLLKDRGYDFTRKDREGKPLAELAKTAAMRAVLASSETVSWPVPHHEGRNSTRGIWRAYSGSDPADPATLRLFAACQGDNLAELKEALAAGARINVRDHKGAIPLGLVVHSGAKDLANELLAAGAFVDLQTGRNHCVLSFAAENGDAGMVELLLQAGADPNGWRPVTTPLIVAIHFGHPDIARRLLDAGADPNLVGAQFGQEVRINPLAEALRKGDAVTVELLLARGANPHARLDEFHRSEDGPDPRFTAPSLLMQAAHGGNVELIRRMIALGQDPHFRTYGGADALHWAAEAEKPEAVEYLQSLPGAVTGH